jgi:hypothetical protein
MIFEIVSTTAMATLAGYSYLKTKGPATNDTEKINRIFSNAGWSGSNGETIRIHRKTKLANGTEYIYQLPLGFDRTKIESNKHILEDGLNVRHKMLEFDPADLLKIKWDRTVIQQIRKIMTSKKIKRKEIDIQFDGMLRIKVYNESMKDKIDWSPDLLIPGSWSVPIGFTRDDEAIRHDFDKSKHLIVAGATGYGKSVVLKLIVTTLIDQQPDNVELSLIDLKGGSAFHRFKDCKQTKFYARDPEEGQEALEKIQEEMNESFKKVVDQGFEDVKEAGIKKRHFIIIDESADLSDYSKAMDIVTDIARRGRSAGYYLVFCTQYPTAQVIPSQTKRNIIARLSYVVDTDTASRVVLDEGGADQLPDIPGRGIYKNNVKRHIVQTPFMTNKQIQERIEPHINIRPRKDDQDHGQKGEETTKDRKHSFEFKKV